MPAPESIHLDGGTRWEYNGYVEKYNRAPSPGAQIEEWRSLYNDATFKFRNRALARFVQDIGQKEETVIPAPTPLTDPERRRDEQIIAPKSADVIAEQLAVTSISEAAAAVIGAKKPIEAFVAMKGITDLEKKLNFVFNDVGGNAFDGSVMTVADAVESWYHGIVAPMPTVPPTPGFHLNSIDPITGEPNPKYGMPARSWDEVVAFGRADFIARFTGGDPALITDAQYLYNVAVKTVIATGEFAKYGLSIASTGAESWTRDVGRLDLQIIGSADREASPFVKYMSRNLPITSPGYLSSQVLPPNTLAESNIDQFVTSVGGTLLTAAQLKAKNFAADPKKDMASYYGPVSQLASVNGSLVESKFGEAFVIDPVKTLDALMEKRPGNFLAGASSGIRNGTVSALIETALRWHRKPGILRQLQVVVESLDLRALSPGVLNNCFAALEKKTDTKTHELYAPLADSQIMGFIGAQNPALHQWVNLFDNTLRKAYVRDLYNSLQGLDGRTNVPQKLLGGLVRGGWGIVSGGVSSALGKKN